jgi:PAS domain S-box-containing protein
MVPRDSVLVRYSSAVVAVWLALGLWSLSPLLHRHATAVFLVAVVLIARLFGFGPALLCAALSAICLDLVVMPPQFRFNVNEQDLERLAVFLILALLVGSLVRQRTQAESRAERARREMAAIAEYSDDAIFSVSPDGTITSWNRGAEELYGYTAEDAIGSSLQILAPLDKHSEVQRNLELLRRGVRVESYPTERLRKDGTRAPVLLTAWPLRNPKGEFIGASAIVRDVTVQKRSEEAVRRSEKLATAGRLAASIAHEINNPLEAVLNLLYLARHDPPQAERYLSMAEQEVARVAQLAQQTLGFVRESDSPAVLNPAAIMDEMLQLYSRKLEGKRIRVSRRYREACQIDGYAGEIRQLVANLLVNAIDAMKTGGSLQVRVEPGRHWSDGRSGVRITVADDGAGIPSTSLNRIFEPFYTTKKEAGTGLGLWVSYGIVQKHGGSIRVRSRVNGRERGHGEDRGSGTVFSIFLPHPQPATRVA